jgi:hypothetical protein
MIASAWRPIFAIKRNGWYFFIMVPPEKISVVLKNSNSTLSTDQFEVYDNVADALVGIFTLKGGESMSIDICADASGNGSVRIRNLDASRHDWVEMDSIILGDVIAV